MPRNFPPRVTLAFLLGGMMLSACGNVSGDNVSAASDTFFMPVKNVIPFEDRKRRKFDNAVIGDLDKDGLQDVIINEHGRHMRVLWNNGETFSDGPIIATGDVHGAAVGDFDKNGLVDVIITQGGGDGANPRRPLWVEVNSKRDVVEHGDFEYFEKGRGRVAKFVKSPVNSELNLFITGFATPEQTKGANHFYNNLGNGKFEFQEHLPNASRLGFKSNVADVNGDEIDDILIFGAGTVRVAQGQADGSFVDETETVLGSLSRMKNANSMTEIDFDNDGDTDLLFTRAEFQFNIESFVDEVENRFAFLTFRKDFLFEDMKIEGDLSLTNLQRTYPNYDLFMGADKRAYPFEGDPHGHQDITIKKEDAQGWPEGDLKSGLYVGYLGDDMWRIGGQTHSRWAGAVENVVSNPTVKTPMNLPVTLLENKGGVFENVTQAAGINVPDQTTSATSADFNNDGFLDIAIMRYGNMAKVNKHVLYLNQGDGTFKAVEDHGLWADEVGTTGGSIEAFDYNLDGRVDVLFSNERGRWHLMKNNSAEANSNNFVVLDVAKTPLENASHLRTKVTVEACDKTLTRKAGTTSSTFSQGLNTVLNFGLGNCAEISKVTLDVQGQEARVLSQEELDKIIVTQRLK